MKFGDPLLRGWLWEQQLFRHRLRDEGWALDLFILIAVPTVAGGTTCCQKNPERRLAIRGMVHKPFKVERQRTLFYYSAAGKAASH